MKQLIFVSKNQIKNGQRMDDGNRNVFNSWNDRQIPPQYINCGVTHHLLITLSRYAHSRDEKMEEFVISTDYRKP